MVRAQSEYISKKEVKCMQQLRNDNQFEGKYSVICSLALQLLYYIMLDSTYVLIICFISFERKTHLIDLVSMFAHF